MPGPGVFAALPSISFELPEHGAWSARHDAALATLAARSLGRPSLAAAIDELELLGEDGAKLWDYVVRATARRLAATGVTRDQFAQLYPEATSAQLDVLDAGPEVESDAVDLLLAESLGRARHAATGEPVAPAHRETAASGAEAAALVIQAALDAEQLRDDELRAAALALAHGHTPLVPPPYELARRSAALDVLAARISDACHRTARAVGCTTAIVKGERFAIPTVTMGGTEADLSFLALLTGARLILLLAFRGGSPMWTMDIAGVPAEPSDVRQPDGTMTLAPQKPGDRLAKARTVAGLRRYLEQLLEEHLQAYPQDGDLFPELDDSALERIFG